MAITTSNSIKVNALRREADLMGVDCLFKVFFTL